MKGGFFGSSKAAHPFISVRVRVTVIDNVIYFVICYQCGGVKLVDTKLYTRNIRPCPHGHRLYAVKASKYESTRTHVIDPELFWCWDCKKFYWSKYEASEVMSGELV